MGEGEHVREGPAVPRKDRWNMPIEVQGSLGVAPDPVEYGREVLSALAYVTADQSREVHVLRLRNALERAGLEKTLRYVLAVLTLTGEYQELSQGYWAPTPVRRVPLGTTVMLIAPSGTKELQRHFPEVRRAGYARILPAECNTDLPIQELSDWAGLRVANSTIWAAKTVQQGFRALSPTAAPADIEYFGLQTKGASRKPIWTTDSGRAISVLPRVFLCRSKISPTKFRHFLGQVENGKLIKEAAIPHEIERMQFGISAFNRTPISVGVDAINEIMIFRVPCILPRPERRVFAAISQSAWSRHGKEYRVETGEHSALLANILRNLGCELRNI